MYRLLMVFLNYIREYSNDISFTCYYIIMKKLIELLNEYSKNIWFFNEEDLQWQTKAWILSKEFWFIKWLVENDKIDREKNVLAFEFSSVYTYDGEDYEDHLKECKLLMLLAIQDEPINFLISILK